MKSFFSVFLSFCTFMVFCCCFAGCKSQSKTDSSENTGISDNASEFYMKSDPEPLRDSETGIVYNDKSAAKNNLKKLNKAIKNLKSGQTLYLKEGIIYFESGVLSGGIQIDNKSGITICGKKTSLVNTSYDPTVMKASAYQLSNVFKINSCKNVTISGITIDYYKHPSVSGTITSYSGGYTYFTAYDEFYKGVRPAVSGGEMTFSTNTFNPDGVVTSEKWFDESGIPVEAVDAENGKFRIKGYLGKTGEQICARFTSGTYASPAIYVYGTCGLNINNTNVVSCPSATVYAPCGNADLSFDNLTIAPVSGSRSLLSSNVDCIHIKGLRGKLSIKNCSFIGIGDDALNVHSRAAVITEINGNKVKASDKFDSGKLDSLWAQNGDTVEFFSQSYVSLGKAKVTGISGSEITFDKLPSGVNKNCVMQNLSYCPETVVENCTVLRGRARGFLLQTKNVNIRSCKFENLRLSAILVSPDITYWYEVGATENMTVHDCEFIRCCTDDGEKNHGVIHIGIGHDNSAQAAETIHKNINISNNTFLNSNTYAVKAGFVDGIVIKDNHLEGMSGDYNIYDSLNADR